MDQVVKDAASIESIIIWRAASAVTESVGLFSMSTVISILRARITLVTTPSRYQVSSVP